MRLWNAETGELEEEFSSKDPRLATLNLRRVAFDPLGNRVAAGAEDEGARIRNLSTSELLRLPTEQPSSQSWGVAWTPDGTRVAAGDNYSIGIWDAASGRLRKRFDDITSQVWDLAFSPDGRQLLAAYSNGRAIIYNADSGAVDGQPLSHDGSVYAASWSSQGDLVATGSMDGTARIWSIDDRSELQALDHGSVSVWGVAFSPNGKQIATGSDDGLARVWDVSTGALIQTFGGASDDVDAVAWSPDGKSIVTGSGDSTARGLRGAD